MRTLRKLTVLSGIPLLALLAGCPGDGEGPPTTTAGPAPATSEVGPPATTAEVPRAPACAATNATGDYRAASMRITLNSDGTVDQIEGKNAAGIWEAPRGQQEQPPESLGACVASIEVFALNDSTKELQNPDGTSTHQHQGASSPPYNTHCHRWVRINNVNVLVHC
jgi:hypothetical protein